MTERGAAAMGAVARITDPVSSTLPTPSIMQWWAFVTIAKLP